MVKYKIFRTSHFDKDLRLAEKRGLNLRSLYDLLKKLQNDEPLEKKYMDHSLTGKYTGYRECHINPDWLLIYKKDAEKLLLILRRTGTHSDLF